MLKDIGITDIDSLFSDIPKKIRIKNLNLQNGLSQQEVEEWLRKLSNVPPQTQSKIITMLGHREDKLAFQAVSKMMYSENLEVRLSAYEAAFQLGKDAVMDDFLNILENTQEQAEIEAIKTELLQLNIQKFASKIGARLSHFTPPAKVMLLEVLSDRKADIKTKPLFKLIDEKDPLIRKTALKTLGNLAKEKDFVNRVETRQLRY